MEIYHEDSSHPSWQMKTNETEVFFMRISSIIFGDFPVPEGSFNFIFGIRKQKKDCEMLRTSNIFGLDKL